MTGATVNVYCGLWEYEDMAFVLHLLRPADLFVDVGANIGSYTILASGAAGARSLSIEPVPATFLHLQENIWLNNLAGRVELQNIGISAESGVLRFSSDQDTVNHVLAAGEFARTETKVPVCSLDSLLQGRVPRLIKIDVEGFERQVLAGAPHCLQHLDVSAIIIELNGSGARYGYSDADVHSTLLLGGFHPFRYAPAERRLAPLAAPSATGNTLYLRNPDFASERLQSAPRFEVHGKLV
jgi:FkbM family methyltransferase